MLPQACSPRGEGPGGGGGRVRVRMGAPPLSQRGREVGGGKTQGLGGLGERDRQRASQYCSSNHPTKVFHQMMRPNYYMLTLESI